MIKSPQLHNIVDIEKKITPFLTMINYLICSKNIKLICKICISSMKRLVNNATQYYEAEVILFTIATHLNSFIVI
jgi:hypothetical protein